MTPFLEGGNRGPFPFHLSAAGAATQPPCAQDQHASVIEKPISAIIDVALIDHVSEAAEVCARFLMSTDDSLPRSDPRERVKPDVRRDELRLALIRQRQLAGRR